MQNTPWATWVHLQGFTCTLRAFVAARNIWWRLQDMHKAPLMTESCHVAKLSGGKSVQARDD